MNQGIPLLLPHPVEQMLCCAYGTPHPVHECVREGAVGVGRRIIAVTKDDDIAREEREDEVETMVEGAEVVVIGGKEGKNRCR